MRNAHKQYSLDARKVGRIKKILGARTDDDALNQLLDLFLTNEKLERSHDDFVRSGAVIEDAVGRLKK